MAGPLVSIITPALNSAKFIRDNVKSVLDQTYPRIEHVIIDGGSSDDTVSIVRSLNPNAVISSEPDKGISDAFNKGLKMANGDVIAILNSDDYYAGREVVLKVAGVFAKSPEIKAVYGILDFLDPVTGEVLLTWGRNCDPSEIKKRMYIPHPTLFVRKEVYEEIGLFRTDYRIAMDYEFALRLARYTRPHFLNYKIACARDMGASGRQWKRGFREVVRALLEHGYYFPAAIMAFRNAVKAILILLGVKGLLYRLWKKNVSPR